jgi:hypothetical protein
MPTAQKKPTLFIGSSTEAIPILRAIQAELERNFTVNAWDQATFGPGQFTLEALEEAIEKCDFALFVATPDDTTMQRSLPATVVRDNVIFELGLFMGNLGRERAFLFVAITDDLHLPSDLSGISIGRFSWPMTNHADARREVSTACRQVWDRAEHLGPKSPCKVDIQITSCPVQIVSRDIVDFDQPDKVILLPANIYFDTTSEARIVEARSALGAIIDKRRGENAMAALDSAIDKELRESNLARISVPPLQSKPGRQIAYVFGSAIRVSSSSADLILAGVTDLEKNGTCFQSRRPSDFFPNVLTQLWKNVATVRSRDEIVVPVLGSGFGGMSREIALAHMLYTFDRHIAECPSSKLCERLIVVVRDQDWGPWVQDVASAMKMLPKLLTTIWAGIRAE